MFIVCHTLASNCHHLNIIALLQICLNSGYSLQDSTALKLAKQHDGDYSLILLWQCVGACIAPYIAGIVIDQSEDPTGDILSSLLIGLHQIVGGNTSPRNCLLHFDLQEKNSDWMKRPIFYLGLVQPSNTVFTWWSLSVYEFSVAFLRAAVVAQQ